VHDGLVQLGDCLFQGFKLEGQLLANKLIRVRLVLKLLNPLGKGAPESVSSKAKNRKAEHYVLRRKLGHGVTPEAIAASRSARVSPRQSAALGDEPLLGVYLESRSRTSVNGIITAKYWTS
jgi:hypothetical protein